MNANNRFKRVCSFPVMSIAMAAMLLIFAGGCPESHEDLTTRNRAILPVAIPSDAPKIPPAYVPEYGIYGYSAWQWGPGEDEGRKFDLMPAGYTGSSNKARLLSFFSMSDIHITDKESPSQVLYFGWAAASNAGGPSTFAGLSQAYSPVVLSTTQVLEAAIKTVNAINRSTPFDFGIAIGDLANCSQTNELRWFIDVLDGKYITPSSGGHLGADTIGYQKPFQAEGLDSSIPWYAAVGNHDQYWMGIGYPTQKVRDAEVGTEVLNMGLNPYATNATEDTGIYVGVVDGTTIYGDVVKGGPESDYSTPPAIVSDSERISLTTDESTTRNFMSQFFTTTSTPVGHGFTQSNLDADSACYTFEPKSNMPIKVIVLDDTCKASGPDGTPAFYGQGWIDEARYTWLTSELQKGEDNGQLMILACHIPINPQADLFDTTAAPQFHADSYKNDEELIAMLHNYPNLILLIAGHRHLNTVTPHPSPIAAEPERGFWEVENSSLRDFPQQFRTFDIRRNKDNSISIFTTNVDPAVEEGSPAADSRGYAIGAARIFGNVGLTDTSSHSYNAELVKKLKPEMQTIIANHGTSLESHENGDCDNGKCL